MGKGFGYSEDYYITIYDIDFRFEKSDPKAFKEKRPYWSIDGSYTPSYFLFEIDVCRDFVSVENVINYVKKQIRNYSKKLIKIIKEEDA